MDPVLRSISNQRTQQKHCQILKGELRRIDSVDRSNRVEIAARKTARQRRKERFGYKQLPSVRRTRMYLRLISVANVTEILFTKFFDINIADIPKLDHGLTKRANP